MDDKVTDEELYAGFTAEQREWYEREVREQYDPELVAESNRRARNMSRAQWQALREEGGGGAFGSGRIDGQAAG